MNTFNFVGPKFDHATQRDLFLDDDVLTPFEEHETMAHLLVRTGKFPSVSQARKNGWDKPIETNWNGIRVGKAEKMVEIFIFNPQYTAAELLEMFPDD